MLLGTLGFSEVTCLWETKAGMLWRLGRQRGCLATRRLSPAPLWDGDANPGTSGRAQRASPRGGGTSPGECCPLTRSTAAPAAGLRPPPLGESRLPHKRGRSRCSSNPAPRPGAAAPRRSPGTGYRPRPLASRPAVGPVRAAAAPASSPVEDRTR